RLPIRRFRFAQLGGDVRQFVPPAVADAFVRKLGHGPRDN
ncbi:MAG: hypothetical protein VW625_09485, partial [Perlucidibaca sp.]